MHDEAITSTPPSTIDQFTSDAELIDKIHSIGFGTLTEFQSAVIPALLAGNDIVASGGRRGRTLAYLVPLAILKDKEDRARTLIVTDTESDAERIWRNATELGLPAAKVGGKGKTGGRNPLLTATVIVGTTQGFLDAFDAGTIDGSKIRRAVLEGTETAIQSGRTEELVNLFHNLPSTQLIVLRKDSAMNIVNFLKKFLKSPQEIQVEDSNETREPERSAAQADESPAQEEDSREQDVEAAPAAQATPPAPVVPAKPKKMPANAEHFSLELNNELAAKANALCDLIEGSGSPATVVFCNSPSDADLTEVLLRKRGIVARKLIGFVPPARVSAAQAELVSGEATALVVTDVSARDLTVANLGLVVNYSIHTDPEIYLQRAAVAEEGTQPVKVVSLVIPMDIPNFFNLKKLLGLTINKLELPPAEEILRSKVRALGLKAQEKFASIDERLKTFSTLIQQDEHKNEIIALLVYNTLEALPNAIAEKARAAESAEREQQPYAGGGDYRDDRRGRGGRGGRQDRDRRGGRRDDRDYERRNDYGEGMDSSAEQGSQADGESMNGDGEGPRGRRHGGDDFEPRTPPARDTRLYIGHGTKDGLDQAAVAQLITSQCQLAPDQVKRTISRPLYTFVDVPEQVADAVVTTLSEAALPSGAKVFIKRAVTITSPRDDARTGGANESNDAAEQAERSESSEPAAEAAPVAVGGEVA